MDVVLGPAARVRATAEDRCAILLFPATTTIDRLHGGANHLKTRQSSMVQTRTRYVSANETKDFIG
jgi:hypothetical protein